MKGRITLLLLIVACFVTSLVHGQTILQRGDLLVLAVNANVNGGPDEISFVCFKDITTGTEIQITDNGYESCVAGQWSGGEGGAIMRRTGATIPKGTVITFKTVPFAFTYPDANWTILDLSTNQLSGAFNMNSSGDQLYFAQGGTWAEQATNCTISGPRTDPNAVFPGNNGRILFGFSTSGSWQSFQMSSQESGLYPGMACFSMSPTTGRAFNKYTGPLTAATQTDWITRVATASNWTTYTSNANYVAASPNYAVSNFVLPILAGGDIPTATWTAPSTPLCTDGASINLNSLITGTTGGTWSGTGVTGSTFNPTGLNGSYNVTYTIQYNSGAGTCPITQTSTINVVQAAAPTAASPAITLCQNATASALSATGSNLLWYTVATGGTGSSTAPTPLTSSTGTSTYYVSQTVNGCESPRTSISVTINSAVSINTVNNQSLCASTATTAINFSGTGNAIYNWTNDNTSIGLAASGTGNIASFTALNSGTSPVTATITATPIAVGYAYVANYGIPIINAGNVSIINTATNAIVGTVMAGSNPFGVSVNATGTRVYVSNQFSNNVSVINTATNTVTNTITVGTQPLGLVVSPDGTRVYVANTISNNVSVINTATNTVIATIPVSLQPQGICISPDGSKVYVANVNSNNVSVINTATNTVAGVIGVGVQPISVAISPDGSRLYATNYGNNNVSIINVATNTVLTTVTAGTAPNGAAVTPDGSKVYVTNQLSNNVTVINTATNTVAATVAVGTNPQGVSVTSDGTKVYVANFGSNTNNVSVINTATNTVSTSITAGPSPHSLGNFIAPTACNGQPITFTITVNPAVAAVSASVTQQPTCSSPTGTITVSSPVGAGYTYSIDGTNFQASTTFSNLSPNSYTVTVKNANGCSNTSSSLTVNAPASAPAAPVTTITQPTCTVSTGSIVVTSPTGTGLTYSIDGTNFQSSTTFNNLAPNTYTVTVKDASGCSNASPAAITATTSVPQPLLSTTQPTCTVSTGSIVVTSPTGAGISYSIDGTNFQSSPTFNNLSPNTYTVTVKNASNCTNTNTATLSSPATMPVPTFTLTQPACTTPTGSLTVNSPIGATFEYSIDGTNFNFSGTFSGIAPGNYTLTVRNQSGCSNAAPFTINTPSSTLPTPTFTITQPTCLATTGSITITSPLGSGYTYGLDPALITNATTFINLTPGTYTLTAYNGSCYSTAPFTINAVPSPPAAPTVTTPVAYCQNATATVLTANGTNLLWYSTAIGGTGNSTAPTPPTTTVGSTTYYVSQTVSGCESPRASIVVDVNAAPAVPTISASGPTTFCSGNNVTLTSSSSSNNQWLLDGNTLAGATGSSYTANQNGNYTVTVTNASNCSSTSLPTVVTINPNPIVFAGIDVYVNEGDSAKLQASASGGSTFTYLWSPSIYLSDATILQPWVVKPLTDNIYTLTVTNEHGCSNNDNVLATVLKDIVVPNAFSPNGDNVNDTWDIPNLSLYPFCTVEIFARSGQLVHSSVGYSKPWNGTRNGKPLPVGVYYYIINLKNGKPIKAGSITLLK